MFDGRTPHDAVRATFGWRNTELSSGNLAKLLNELAGDASKQTQWRALLRKGSLIVEDDFAAVNRAIHDFLVLLADGARGQVRQSWFGSLRAMAGGRGGWGIKLARRLSLCL